jgi:hypothetical protein
MKAKATLKICNRGYRFYKSSSCPVCPICWAGFYKEKYGTEFPGLSAPALRALLNAGITASTALSKHTENEILGLHGMGTSLLPLLRSILKAKGLKFRK